MQTWAKRGVQAALVTGGMIAAGTGVASASENCPDRPGSPLGGPMPRPDMLNDGTPSRSGPCFAGELFPEAVGSVPPPAVDASAQQSTTALSGTIDPVRDLLPAVQDALTREIPRITDEPRYQQADPAAGAGRAGQARHAEQVWIPPESADASAALTQPLPRIGHPLELAGWFADSVRPGDSRAGSLTPISGHSNAALGILPQNGTRGRHAAEPALGSPAEGFHRSLSWSGPIGDVVRSSPATAASLPAGAAATDMAPALVVPSEDPAVFGGLAHPAGLVSPWENTLGAEQARQLPTALLSPRTDLTAGELGGGSELRTIPQSLLSSVLSADPVVRPASQQEFVPLQVPGELQEQVHELPDLSGPVLLEAPATATARDGGAPGVEAPLPVLGELNALGGGETSLPGVDRITGALEDNRFSARPVGRSAESALHGFSSTPELTDVTVTVLDELAAAVPERLQVARNPFRPSPVARTAPAGGMALPVLGGGIPDITAAQDLTLPMPAIREDDTSALRALDAAAILRGV